MLDFSAQDNFSLRLSGSVSNRFLDCFVSFYCVDQLCGLKST